MAHIIQKIFHHVPQAKNNLSIDEVGLLFDVLQGQKLLHTVFYDGGVKTRNDFIEMMQNDDQWLYVYAASHEHWQNAVERVQLHPSAFERSVKTQKFRLRGMMPLGFCWLNNFSGKGAMIHFSLFAEGLPFAQSIGEFVVRSLLFAKWHTPAPWKLCTGQEEVTQVDSPCNQAHWADAPSGKESREEQLYTQGVYSKVSLGNNNGGDFCLDALYGLTPQCFRHAVNFIKKLGFIIQGTLPFAMALQRDRQVRYTHGVLSSLTREQLMIPRC